MCSHETAQSNCFTANLEPLLFCHRYLQLCATKFGFVTVNITVTRTLSLKDCINI